MSLYLKTILLLEDPIICIRFSDFVLWLLLHLLYKVWQSESLVLLCGAVEERICIKTLGPFTGHVPGPLTDPEVLANSQQLANLVGTSVVRITDATWSGKSSLLHGECSICHLQSLYKVSNP